jgi:hypothetical protein
MKKQFLLFIMISVISIQAQAREDQWTQLHSQEIVQKTLYIY